MVVQRKWRIAAYVLFAVAVESGDVPGDDALRRAATARGRAARVAPRRGQLPVGSHGRVDRPLLRARAAVTSRFAAGPWRVAVWAVALAIPPIVALSRIYRGMHHPIDALAGDPDRHRGDRRGRLRVPRRRRGARPARGNGGRPMTRVAVVAHSGKTIGGGLVELRRVLEEAGVDDPLWYEVPKSRKAPKQVQAGARRGRRARLRLGRRRHRAALPRRPRRHRRRRSRSSLPGRRTCSRRTSASRTTSRKPCRSGFTARGARSTSAGSTASASA